MLKLVFLLSALCAVAPASGPSHFGCPRWLSLTWLFRSPAPDETHALDRLFFRRLDADAGGDETMALSATTDLVQKLQALKLSETAVRHGLGLLLVSGADDEPSAYSRGLSGFLSVRKASLEAAALLLTKRPFRPTDEVRVANALVRTALKAPKEMALHALEQLDLIRPHVHADAVHAASSGLEALPSALPDEVHAQASAVRQRLAATVLR